MSHPAPDELLLDYATGVLPEGPALAVALHVALDPAAQRTVQRLRALGGALLEGETAAVDDAALDQALGRLDSVSGPPPGFEWAPAALRPYLSGKRWRRVFGGFEEIRLGLHGDSHRVSLLRLPSGRGLPMHRHVANEYTVVLHGGYTDVTGRYGVGDFAVGPGAQQHKPIADPGEPCIALTVVEQPIVLTGRWARWLNPVLRRGWM